MGKALVTPIPTKEELEALRDAGKTREQIAEIYGVSLSQVKRWISSRKVRKKIIRKDNESKPLVVTRHPSIIDDDGLPLMERAQRILGDRLTEKRGIGYRLDGRVCSIERVLEAAGLQMRDHHT